MTWPVGGLRCLGGHAQGSLMLLVLGDVGDVANRPAASPSCENSHSKSNHREPFSGSSSSISKRSHRPGFHEDRRSTSSTRFRQPGAMRLHNPLNAEKHTMSAGMPNCSKKMSLAEKRIRLPRVHSNTPIRPIRQAVSNRERFSRSRSRILSSSLTS